MAATVVPPVAPCTIATGRSLALSFSAPSVATSRSSSSGSRPTWATPSSIAIVAGNAPRLGDRLLELERCLEILRARQAVRDDRRLERDDRLAVAERAGNTLGENNSSGHDANLPHVSASAPEPARAVIMSGMQPANAATSKASPLSICTIGDLILDVIVLPDHELAPDADTPATIRFAAGGQAANVAAWASALGATGRLICKRGTDASSELAVRARRAARRRDLRSGGRGSRRRGRLGPRRPRPADDGIGSGRRLAAREFRARSGLGEVVRCAPRLGLLPAARADGRGRDRGREVGPARHRRSRLGSRHRDRRRPSSSPRACGLSNPTSSSPPSPSGLPCRTSTRRG